MRGKSREGGGGEGGEEEGAAHTTAQCKADHPANTESSIRAGECNSEHHLELTLLRICFKMRLRARSPVSGSV